MATVFRRTQTITHRLKVAALLQDLPVTIQGDGARVAIRTDGEALELYVDLATAFNPTQLAAFKTAVEKLRKKALADLSFVEEEEETPPPAPAPVGPAVGP